MLPDFKIYDTATVISTGTGNIYLDRSIDRQRYRYISMEGIDGPEIDPNKYSQLVFGKVAKAIQWNK